jgi:glucokinase
VATGGIFLGGGIAPKIVGKLGDATFMKAFIDKGRLSSLLELIPVRVIMNDMTALLGAASVAAMQAGVQLGA